MTVAFLCHDKDVEELIFLLEWVKELGPLKNHHALIVTDAGTAFDKVMKARGVAEEIFSVVDLITNEHSVTSWIEGPKSLFIAAARWAYKKNVPFLLMDSDAIPLRTGWLDAIEDEYLARGFDREDKGNGYMGCLFACDQPGLPKILMGPCSVYPSKATELIPLILPSGRHWDVEMQSVVLRDVHGTKLLQHLFGEMNNPPTFAHTAVPGTRTFALDWINPEAVVFHRNKDRTLINLLREKRGSKVRPVAAHKSSPMSFFQLGRYGDLILLLPAFKEWADRSGQPVEVFVSREFGSVFDGVSYVKPMKLPFNWTSQAGQALKHARTICPDVTLIQMHAQGLPPVPQDDLPSYSITLWVRAGLSELDYHRLPLVFDRRSPEREAALVKKWRKTDKPLLLLNFEGWTSPFPAKFKLIPPLTKQFGERCEFLNTNETKAHRIYDLLGLMDAAAGLITIDTATLHIAAAAKCPYVAYRRGDGQAGSIPKGNVALTINYGDAERRLPEMLATVEGWLK